MLSSIQLASLRGVLTSSFDQSGTINRPARVDDGEGGGTIGFSAAGTALCRVGPMGLTGTEELIASKMTNITLWRITFPALTDVRETDQITTMGETYEVLAVIAPRSKEMARRVAAGKVE